MENNSATFDAGRIRHPDVAYESRDLSHHVVFAFLLILAVGVFLIVIAVWGIFRNLGGNQYAGHQTTNSIMTSNEQLREVGGDPALSFPLPRLQPNDIADLNKFRLKEEERLNTYGWVDVSKGRIHIPVERALDMMAVTWTQQQETLSTARTSSSPQLRAPQTAKDREREQQ
jgi:hypothetical protein